MSDMTERNCNKCIHHTSGMCDSWNCKMQTVEDVKKEAVNKYVKAVVEELEERKALHERLVEYENKNGTVTEKYQNIKAIDVLNKAIEIVKQGGAGKEHEAEEYKGGWISVKDRLPDKAGSYLVIGKSGGATVTRWYMPSEFYPEGHFGGNSTDYIRYWMPRPEPPKERD